MDIIGQRQRGHRKKYCPTPVTTTKAKNTTHALSLFRNTAPRRMNVNPDTHTKIQNFVTTLIHAALSPLGTGYFESLCRLE